MPGLEQSPTGLLASTQVHHCSQKFVLKQIRLCPSAQYPHLTSTPASQVLCHLLPHLSYLTLKFSFCSLCFSHPGLLASLGTLQRTSHPRAFAHAASFAWLLFSRKSQALSLTFSVRISLTILCKIPTLTHSSSSSLYLCSFVFSPDHLSSAIRYMFTF